MVLFVTRMNNDVIYNARGWKRDWQFTFVYRRSEWKSTEDMISSRFVVFIVSLTLLLCDDVFVWGERRRLTTKDKGLYT